MESSGSLDTAEGAANDESSVVRVSLVSWRTLLESWSAEFVSRCDRVRHLIGDTHWQSDGSHKEALLRSFLRDRIPTRMAVEQGFILNPRSSTCSAQIDILVRDTHLSAPFLCESAITICGPESVCAVVEVKSTFTSSALHEALRQILKTWQVLSDYLNEGRIPWVGILFASVPDSRTNESILQTIAEQISNEISSIPSVKFRIPDHLCIASVDQFSCFARTDRVAKTTTLRYFPTERMSMSVAAIDLLSHIYAMIGSNTQQSLEESLGQVIDIQPLIRIVQA